MDNAHAAPFVSDPSCRRRTTRRPSVPVPPVTRMGDVIVICDLLNLSHRPGLVRHYYNDVTRRENVTEMDEHDWLAQRFEENRTHLRAVAYRMLGSISEADDAVQEAWLKLSRSNTSDIQNLGGWLTTVVARLCLNTLRSRSSRREVPLEEPLGGPPSERVPDPIVSRADGIDPEQEALLADSVGLALLVVLETLTPAERLAFVLHDMFAVPFEEIAPIVGRTSVATRQLASRARRRVHGKGRPEGGGVAET